MQNSHYKQLAHDRGICVIIPTYNNAGTIADVVERAFGQCDDVIVVNDGSTDDTSQIINQINGITIVEYSKNAGKGTALKRGFKKAREMGFAYAITLDGDGQHYPEDIPALINANVANPGALIVGERDLQGVTRSKGSRFANRFSNFWFAVQTLRHLRDTQSGYRLYPLRHLYGISMLTSRYEAELELLVMAAWHGVKIATVPVRVYYPPQDERVSHFRPGKDFARISLLNTVLCILALVYALPLGILRISYTTIYTIFALAVYLVGALGVITSFALVYVGWKKIRKQPSRCPSPLHRVIYWYSRLTANLLGVFGSPISVRNSQSENFQKAAIIICNHQSHLDLIVQLSLSPRIVFLTNDWVWHSPFFGYFVRQAEYYPVSEGVETLLPKLKSLADRGYSISVYPEGTRSRDGQVGRFHKGAFHIAKELGLDIIPMVQYGANHALPKKGWYMRRWPICLEINERVTPEKQMEFGASELERARKFRRFTKEHLQALSNEIEQNVI
ncbi:MAG: glycosyltransferase [Bacteroidales bacterium]|nr:glycosyltransferase [Bacteroidales bacterium]